MRPCIPKVVTAADDSTMAVWEVETGSKCMLFTNAHGNEEITCLAFDQTWRKLITGARNGTVKVGIRHANNSLNSECDRTQIWNIQNGHNLHCLEAVSEAEITGVMPIPDKQMTLAVGWSRKIVKYHTSEHDVRLRS
jgi:hypothetical protein